MSRVLLFDLCDTVVRTAGVRALLDLPGLEAGHDEASLDAWFNNNPLFYAYERGEVGDSEFLHSMRRGPWKGAGEAELATALERLILHEIDGVPQWLASLKKHWPLYALSNNNPLLWRGTLRVSRAIGLFDGVFLSFDIGRLKPEEQTFAYVLRRLNRDAADVVFIDDNPVCVEGARRAGMDAVLFTGAAETAARVDSLLERY